MVYGGVGINRDEAMNPIEELNKKPFFTLNELSKIVGKSVTTLRKWRNSDQFPKQHTANQYSAKEVLDWYFKRGEWATE